jgi:hypothetical protein
MIPETLFNTAAIAATVIGALGSLFFGLWKVAIKYHNDLRTRLDRIDKCSKRGYQRMKRWEPLLQMLAPNGGKSLNDAIRRLETRGQEIENQLVRNSYLKRSMLNDMPLFETNELGAWVWSNSALDELCGVPENVLLGPSWLRMVDATSRSDTQQAWHLAVSSGVPFYWDTFLVNEDSGDKSKVTISAQPIHNNKNELVGYAGKVSMVV